MPRDYKNCTAEMFRAALEEVVARDFPGAKVLDIPGVYEVVAEHLNNEALDQWGEDYPELCEVWVVHDAENDVVLFQGSESAARDEFHEAVSRYVDDEGGEEGAIRLIDADGDVMEEGPDRDAIEWWRPKEWSVVRVGTNVRLDVVVSGTEDEVRRRYQELVAAWEDGQRGIIKLLGPEGNLVDEFGVDVFWARGLRRANLVDNKDRCGIWRRGPGGGFIGNMNPTEVESFFALLDEGMGDVAAFRKARFGEGA